MLKYFPNQINYAPNLNNERIKDNILPEKKSLVYFENMKQKK